MIQSKFSAFIFIISLGLAAAMLVRSALGRDRPDLAAWVSIDDGLWTFEKTYASGNIGPFEIGEARGDAREKLAKLQLLEQDHIEISEDNPRWRISLPAKNGGFVTYTVDFEGDRIKTVQSFYSVFAGL